MSEIDMTKNGQARNDDLSGRDLNASKNLVFVLENERFGIALSTVKEVIGLVEITPVPHVPKFFKGLINLRGSIISVLDLRLKLGLVENDYLPKKTSIIIAEIQGFTIGAIVDDVEEVVGFEPSQIETELDIQSSVQKTYIYGVAKVEGKGLILLLDMAKALSVEEMALLKSKAKS